MNIAEKTLQLKEDFDAVYEAGEKLGYDKGLLAWWDALTNKGKRASAIRTFSASLVGDIEGIENLPYPMKLTGQCDYLFYQYNGKKLLPKNVLDLTGIRNTYDNATVIHSLFYGWYDSNSGTTDGVVPDYGIPAMSFYTQTYYNSTAIRTIELIRCHENTKFDRTFSGTNNLVNITFEGVIGTNIDFGSCPLSVASFKNVATQLKDYSTDASKHYIYTLTVKATAFEELEKEGATAEYNGTACTWADYIGYKKWNLTKA